MAIERRRARRVLTALAVLLALFVAAAPARAQADTAWWHPLAFAGQRVLSVSVANSQLVIATAKGNFASGDRGVTFSPTSSPTIAPLPVLSAGTTWDIRDGTVVTGAGVLHADPGAPFLGAGAHLLAAPAAAPGVVVAVGADNHVWRRSASGSWATAFVPLPAGGLSGAPPVTSLAAFTTPLTTAVYLGIDGYGVLLSQDGGDDWIRADPGLPENVLGLAADAHASALYAATDQGLYVHHLQSFPAPPAYTDSALWVRWLGIGLVALLASVAALLGLRRLLPAAAQP